VAVEPRRLRSPMVGRDDELDLLRLLLARTLRHRRPNLVTLLGPPGIGKSRLALELTESLSANSVRVLRGRCLPYDGGLGYWPLAEILKTDAGILDNDPPDAIVAKARSRLDPRFAGTPESLGTTQVLLSSIGIASGSDPLAGAEPSAARRVLAGAWWRYFEALATEQPLVAVIEDIHWADDALLELIEFLAGHVSAPLLVVCAARPELWEHRPGWSAGLANATAVGLAPLSPEDGTTLIENLLGGAPAELVDEIMRRSEGNPFFTEELLRMMSEDGTLAERNGEWALTRELPARLPDTIQAVIASRIDLLSSAEKRTIQAAAVVGRSFWVGSISSFGLSGVETTLERLLDKGLIRERETSAIAGEREFTFHHVLTRDVAYESIPRSQRPKAHEAILRWMEQTTRGRDEEFAEILSYHAEQTGDLDRAARYAMLAGHRHRRVFAASEAIDWYDRALQATDGLSSEASALLRVETALSRGDACEQLGRFAEARTDYERALDAARRRPSGSREWLEIRALAARVQALWKEDRYAEAETLLPEAIESATAGASDDLVARLWYAAGAMAHGAGDWNRARSCHLRALEVATAAGDLEDEALVRHGLAVTGFFIGPFDEARSHALRADELLRGLGQRPMVHRNGATVAWLQWLTDDRDAAAAAARSALAGSRDVGNRRDEATALSVLAIVETSRGNLGSALRAADDAVATAVGVGAPRDELTARFWRLWPLAELRDQHRFDEDVAAAREIAARLETRLLAPALTSAWGLSLARAGETDRAEEAFARARREADGVELDILLVPFFELICWEETGDGARLADAGGRLLVSARGRSRAFAAWARHGLALADFLAGDADGASAGAAAAARAAEAVSELPVVWRSGSLLQRARAASDGTGDEAAATVRASEILSRIVDGLEDDAARARFLTRPDVASVLGPTEGDGQA
jgi:tetratricopeptide (TPR) repeat protein